MGLKILPFHFNERGDLCHCSGRDEFVNALVYRHLGDSLHELHTHLRDRSIRSREMLQYVSEFVRPCMVRVRSVWIARVMSTNWLWRYAPLEAIAHMNPRARSVIGWMRYAGHSTVGNRTLIREWSFMDAVGNARWRVYVVTAEPWGAAYEIKDDDAQANLHTCLIAQLCDLLEDPRYYRDASDLLARHIVAAYIDMYYAAHGAYDLVEVQIATFNNTLHHTQG